MAEVVKYSHDLQERLSGIFDCGNSYINEFLRGVLSLDDGIGKTYVLLDDDDDLTFDQSESEHKCRNMYFGLDWE